MLLQFFELDLSAPERSLAALLTALALTVATGYWFLAVVRVGERTDKSDSPEVRALHGAKQGTPTVGGIFMIGSLLASAGVWMGYGAERPFGLAGLVCIAGFAVVGLADDLVKLRVPGAKGLSQRWKHGLLCLLAAGIGWWLVSGLGLEGVRGGPSLWLPGFAEPLAPLGYAFGLPFVFFAVLTFTSTAHAVNLTDGLDGLAAGTVGIAALGFGVVFAVEGAGSAAAAIPAVEGADEMIVLLGATVGATLGFLYFNAAPARVFMGDVGSLGLGAALAYAAVVTRTELLLVVIGGVFVSEAGSVILQVFWRRRLGRKLFHVAPWHHHFQVLGLQEKVIVARFWYAGAACAVAGLALTLGMGLFGGGR